MTIKHQADVCASAIGDTSIPVMVDHEPDGSGAPTPSVTDALDFANSMRGHGYRVPPWYLPHGVWQDHLGSPTPVSAVWHDVTDTSDTTGSRTVAWMTGSPHNRR